MLDAINPYTSFGYSPTHLDIYQAGQNDIALIACPALMGGLTDVDANAGVVPGYNLWSA